MSSTSPLLPVTANTSLKLTRPISTGAGAPSRIRLGRFHPGHLSLTRRYSSPPPHSPTSTSPTPNTFSGRLKQLIKVYGWYALGVYLAFGVVDFGIAFALINFFGADQVSKWTAEFKSFVKETISGPHVPSPGDDSTIEPVTGAAGGGGHEGLYAMIILAYTVHKTLFLPFRVGMTAAFTPKIVNWLSARGWAGRAGTVRAANHMREKLRGQGSKGQQQD